MINFINKLTNYSYVLKQETELLIPATTGNRTIKIQAGTELCQAQLKLASSLFCFLLAQPTELELD